MFVSKLITHHLKRLVSTNQFRKTFTSSIPLSTYEFLGIAISNFFEETSCLMEPESRICFNFTLYSSHLPFFLSFPITTTKCRLFFFSIQEGIWVSKLRASWGLLSVDTSGNLRSNTHKPILNNPHWDLVSYSALEIWMSLFSLSLFVLPVCQKSGLLSIFWSLIPEFVPDSATFFSVHSD